MGEGAHTAFCHLSPAPFRGAEVLPTCFVAQPQAPGFFVRTIKVTCQIFGDLSIVLALGKSGLLVSEAWSHFCGAQ